MFDSLTDQMRTDENSKEAQRERVVRYAVVAVLSLVLFSALFCAVRFVS